MGPMFRQRTTGNHCPLEEKESFFFRHEPIYWLPNREVNSVICKTNRLLPYKLVFVSQLQEMIFTMNLLSCINNVILYFVDLYLVLNNVQINR